MRAFNSGNPNAGEPADIRAEENAMEAHLRKCMFAPLRDTAPSYSQSCAMRSGSSGSPHLSPTHSQSSMKRSRQQSMSRYIVPPIIDDQKDRFQRLILEFMAENSLPASFVETWKIKRLVDFRTATPGRIDDDLDAHEPMDSDADDVEPEERGDHILFECSQILSSGSGANQSDDDSLVEEILDHGQIRPSWPKENVPNWPQEPTAAKLKGLRGIKVELVGLFEGVCLPDSF
ncbi:hypothetical protein H310_15327 [Aphanomyces invadans]|uniref:Uncharacterized protein n=1 Tax=Aphanomyces invadans TaxID=157072 RepID=A0A024T7M4_9STRA|nr:hypothetical protein H310_15327 [Aphanomyces invadans]ETV89834.1 hypothetical protein H310_15327 [Aphanomyces invadans]|eukprot:XP_008881534.1 hypothetical protein H310_15327 [Aphanomyces invadans]